MFTAKCAEVLVPNRLSVEYIEGAFVANKVAENALSKTGFALPITLNPGMFFLQGR